MCARLATMASTSSGLLKPAAERRRQRGHENKKGRVLQNQGVKSMTSHWLKSIWAALLSGPQLAGETERNGPCTLD